TTPAPAPATPTPTPSPAATSCSRLAPARGSGDCSKEAESFLTQVDAAIDQLAREQPHVFDLGDAIAGGAYKVRSVGQYYVGIIDNLEKMGLCADFDGEELAVTNSSAFSDQYHIMTSDKYARRGANSYRATCHPAVLPTPKPNLPQTPGCTLAPSKEKACDRESSKFLNVVDGAIEQVAKDHPEYFDLNDRRNENWYRIVNGNGYISALEAELRKKGVCARFDGDEIAVKDDNKFSEQFDVYYQGGYTRRGSGSYRTSCYPAAF
ncbi:MAG TPA: hypothetical protein VF310_04035, partial [Vicinamibacteria bacterium]